MLVRFVVVVDGSRVSVTVLDDGVGVTVVVAFGGGVGMFVSVDVMVVGVVRC